MSNFKITYTNNCPVFTSDDGSTWSTEPVVFENFEFKERSKLEEGKQVFVIYWPGDETFVCYQTNKYKLGNSGTELIVSEITDNQIATTNLILWALKSRTNTSVSLNDLIHSLDDGGFGVFCGATTGHINLINKDGYNCNITKTIGALFIK